MAVFWGLHHNCWRQQRHQTTNPYQPCISRQILPLRPRRLVAAQSRAHTDISFCENYVEVEQAMLSRVQQLLSRRGESDGVFATDACSFLSIPYGEHAVLCTLSSEATYAVRVWLVSLGQCVACLSGCCRAGNVSSFRDTGDSERPQAYKHKNQKHQCIHIVNAVLRRIYTASPCCTAFLTHTSESLPAVACRQETHRRAGRYTRLWEDDLCSKCGEKVRAPPCSLHLRVTPNCSSASVF